MAEPMPKKPKVDDKNVLFVKFKSDKDKMDHLSYAFKQMFDGKIKLQTLHVREANARSSLDFSRATCDTVPMLSKNKHFRVFSAGSVFADGMGVIKDFLEENNLSVPGDEMQKVALKKLLQFLISPPKELVSLSLKEGPAEDECELAVRLAETLLSKLAVCGNYMIDKKYPTKNKNLKEEFNGKFEDTSFGCSDGWHGRVDILMEHLLVELNDAGYDAGDNGDEDCDDVSLDDGDDNKPCFETTRPYCSKVEMSKMLAQTIVYSFLKLKDVTEKEEVDLKTSLIPSIGFCKDKLIIMFYDCLNDVLLSSRDLPLFLGVKGESINFSAIVFLWLTLNYNLFCSGITEKMKQQKSSFHEQLGPDYLEKYKTKVERPCKARQADDFLYWDDYWPVYPWMLKKQNGKYECHEI